MYNDDDFNEEEVENGEQSQSQNKNPILEFYETNKKLVWILGGVIIFIIIFSVLLGGGDNNTTIPNNEVKLEISRLSETISIGNTTQLSARVIDNQNAIILWSSSDSSVATVDIYTGIVKGVDYGVALITATYTDVNNQVHTKSCEVVVANGNPNLPITSVEFQEGELMISAGDEYELNPIFKPENGYITDVKYTSYNKDVVEVSQNGLVKALKVGKATITLDVNNGQFKDEINVNVLEESIISQIVINPTKIEFIDPLLPIEVDETVELDYDYSPDNATISNLKWESSDPTVATVENGMVKGIKIGETVITVTALNGQKAHMTVKVEAKHIPVSSIEILSEKSVTLNVGGVHTISVNTIPADASNKEMRYTSSNPSVATVDSSTGQVKAVAAGSTTITVTSVDGNKTAKVNITVTGSSSGSTEGSSGGGSGGGSTSSIGKLSYKAKNGSTASIYINNAKSRTYELPITVSVGTEPISSVKICVAKCRSDDCENVTCDKQEVLKSSFPYELKFTEGNGLYVIKATKCANGNCVDVQDNYVNITSGASTENPGGSTGSESSKISITIPDGANLSVKVGSDLVITPTVTGGNTNRMTCSFAATGSNGGTVSVRTVGKSCYVTGVKAGTATVRFTSSEDSSVSTLATIKIESSSSSDNSPAPVIVYPTPYVNWQYQKDGWDVSGGSYKLGKISIGSSGGNIDVDKIIYCMTYKGNVCPLSFEVNDQTYWNTCKAYDGHTGNTTYGYWTTFVNGIQYCSKSTTLTFNPDSFNVRAYINKNQTSFCVKMRFTDGTVSDTKCTSW